MHVDPGRGPRRPESSQPRTSRCTLTLDEARAEERYAREPAEIADPVRLFDRAWAHRLLAAARGVRFAVSRHVAEGGEGARELAEAVLAACEDPSDLRFAYELSEPLESKLKALASVYGADRVDIAPTAFRDLSRFERLGFGGLPVLVAKTHLSVTADPADRTLAATSGWVLPVREVRLAAGAGYVYALTGEITTMPGLGSHPGAEAMDLTDCGEIVGLS